VPRRIILKTPTNGVSTRQLKLRRWSGGIFVIRAKNPWPFGHFTEAFLPSCPQNFILSMPGTNAGDCNTTARPRAFSSDEKVERAGHVFYSFAPSSAG